MDAPQEGRAEDAPRERQALLPGLGASGSGWTVFGPSDEETGPEQSAEDEPREAHADPVEPRPESEPEAVPEPEAVSRPEVDPPTDPAPEAEAVSTPVSVPEPVSELEGSSPNADPVLDAEPEDPPVAIRSEEPSSEELAEEVDALASSGEPHAATPEPVEPRDAAAQVERAPATRSTTRSGLPLPWALVLLLALATAIAGVLSAHLRDQGTNPGGDGSGLPEGATNAAALSAAEVQRLEGELDALRGELAQAREEAGQTEQLRDELEATRALVTQRITSLEGDLGAVREQIEQGAPAPAATQPPDDVGATEAPPDPEVAPVPPLGVRRARAFELVLARLESGRGSEALRLVEGFDSDGDFSADEPVGQELLAELVGGWAALERAGIAAASSTALPETEALAAARAHLLRTGELRADFEARAADWLGSGGPPDPTAERLARLDRAVEGLSQRVAAAASGVEALHEQDWQWIVELGVPQDPALVVRHAESFGCEHESEALSLTLEAFAQGSLRSGDLDLEGMARAQHLAAWGQHVLERAPERRSPEEIDLLWLWYARRWYVDGVEPADLDWSGLSLSEVLAPREDWRAELRLSALLSAQDSGWPPAPGVVSVYRVDATGPARWRVDVSERVDRAGFRRWIARRHFDAAGQPLGGAAEVVLEVDGLRTRYAGAEGALLDLRACGPELSVAPFPILAQRAPPVLAGLESAEVESVSGHPAAGACLVYRQGEWTRWFAPGLGLVREVREGPDGWVRIELCALGSVR